MVVPKGLALKPIAKPFQCNDSTNNANVPVWLACCWKCRKTFLFVTDVMNN